MYWNNQLELAKMTRNGPKFSPSGMKGWFSVLVYLPIWYFLANHAEMKQNPYLYLMAIGL